MTDKDIKILKEEQFKEGYDKLFGDPQNKKNLIRIKDISFKIEVEGTIETMNLMGADKTGLHRTFQIEEFGA